MQDLIAKIELLRKTLAAMKPKNASNSLVPALSAPTVKPLSMPSVSSAAKAPKPKLPGMSPSSTKDPKKMAEQLKNPRPKKPKIEVLKVEDNGQWSLTKAEPDFRIPKKMTFDMPHVDTTNPMNIHAEHHGFGGNMNTAHGNQKTLIHGIDMSGGRPLKEQTATKGNKWMYNPHSDKHMIVKPASGAEFGDKKTQDFFGHLSPDGLNTSRREVLSHNLAHDAGLGNYFPTTAGFTHRGEDYSAQEKTPGSSVRTVNRNKSHGKREHLENTIKHMHGTGDLHKLAIFDALMGNNDRHLGNMILDPEEKKIHHIDSGRSVDYSSLRRSEPSGLLRLAHERGLSNELHPKAAKWLESLDEKNAGGKIEKYVQGDSKFKKNFLDRLHNLKTILKEKPNTSLSDAILSLSKIKGSGMDRVQPGVFDRTMKKFGENNSV